MINRVFIQVLMFTSDGKVKQNMQMVNLPYKTGGSKTEWSLLLSYIIYVTTPQCDLFLYFWLLKGDIAIFEASSFHILLQTSFGLQIQIQHVPLMQIYVTLDLSYRTKTRG